MTLRASCLAIIPLLGNMIVIPLLIFFVEKCQKKFKLTEDKTDYEKFVDANINLIRDHFHQLMLFEINIFGIAVLNNNQIDYFQGKCFLLTAIFVLSRFMHIYTTIFTNSKKQNCKNYEIHLMTFGENISLMLNIFMMGVNLFMRI